MEVRRMGKTGEVYRIHIRFADDIDVHVIVDDLLQVTLLVGKAVEERYTAAESAVFRERTVPSLVACLHDAQYVTSSKSGLLGREVTFTFTCEAPPLMENTYTRRGFLGD
jgi:hypothetical protein